MTLQTRRREIVGLAVASAATALLLFVISGYDPVITPDTTGYLDPGAPPEAWARPRNPVFGWILSAVPGAGFGPVPVLQTLLYLLATAMLHLALRDYGLSLRAATAVTASLLLANVLLLWHHAVHPELTATAFSILALALVFRLAVGRRFAWHTVFLGLALGLAYMLRPTLLPAILLFPALYAVLAKRRDGRARWTRVLIALGACALPFTAVSTTRWLAVGDFNIVSFGGFQMSGMAGLMLTPQIADRLPPDLAPLAHRIIELRTAAEARGDILETPLNWEGERSFVSAAIGYFDVYARTYDSLLHGEITELQGEASWVEFNDRLMRLSLATIRAAPERYLAWLVGGTVRMVGRLLVTNLPLMLAAMALVVLYPATLWRRRRVPSPPPPASDVDVLIVLTAVYTLSAGALSVLVSFPAARYLDTAGLIVPALPIFGLLGLAGEWRRGRDGGPNELTDDRGSRR